MRARLLVLFGATAVACATSNDVMDTPDSGSTGAVTPEGGVTDVPDASSDVAAPDAEGEPSCSVHGWCETVLPDPTLDLRDLWPLPGRAFAIADSEALGIKVLEWTEADSTWRYIDDTTQNAPGIGAFASTVWAPSENEVYFTVTPGWIYHGRRPAPGTAFTWSRQQLPTDDASSAPDADHAYSVQGIGHIALGVWGADATHVHAWLRNTIFRFPGDDGLPWEPEFVAAADAPTESVYFFAASGATPDDVWFAGARTRFDTAGCGLVVRKTGAGYESVVDGELDGIGTPCAARPDVVKTGGWLTGIQSIGSNRFVAVMGGHQPVRFSPSGDSYTVDVGSPLPTWAADFWGEDLLSVFSIDDTLWLGGQGFMFRGGADAWTGGAYSTSSVAIDGFPATSWFGRVRGTSNTNLWAIGAFHALHKTTP